MLEPQSGDVEAGVERSLDAQVIGAGGIPYSGNPAPVNRRVTGQGAVRSARPGE